MHNPYQTILDRLDLHAALKNASQSNDLVPPRYEDKVGGELGNRFSEALARDLRSGAYDPHPAPVVAVPKSDLTTRPARVLTLPDRVVYEAIVSLLRPRIDTFLLGNDIVFWPRGDDSAGRRWAAFEKSAIQTDCSYVVRSDISNFYESIDHELLATTIVNATGYRDVADVLQHFLARVMGFGRGLPQGVVSSDTLATVILGGTRLLDDTQWLRVHATR